MTAGIIVPDRKGGDTETQRHGEPDLTERIIGAAIEVHRRLGPRLLESAYEACLVWELREAGLSVARQTMLPLIYKGLRIENAYRIDLIVARQAIVEIKTVEKLTPVHSAQVLTYLRLTGLHVGLLLNFNVAVLKHGIRRMIL